MLDVRSWITKDTLQHYRGLCWLLGRLAYPGCFKVFWYRFVVFGPAVLRICEACCLVWDGEFVLFCFCFCFFFNLSSLMSNQFGHNIRRVTRVLHNNIVSIFEHLICNKIHYLSSC